MAVPVSGTGQARIRQEPAEGIPLQLASDSQLVVQAHFIARLSESGEHLGVRKSAFSVSYAGAHGEPLFRYEYDESMTPALPRAHLQIGKVQNFAALSALSDGSSRIARQREAKIDRGKRFHRSEDLHFPLGGDRFRPALEDVLQFLITQLGVRAEEHWRDAVRESRRTWRGRQLASAVRDNPAGAASALSALGYVVRPPAGGGPPSRDDHLIGL